jgi:pyruvate dehydrogenase E2 component (dihydrolipoamide acetyltransferase)
MGAMGKEPVVREGKVVIRDILPMSATLDHRLIDGPRGGKLAVGVDEYCQDPEQLLEREGGEKDSL